MAAHEAELDSDRTWVPPTHLAVHARLTASTGGVSPVGGAPRRGVMRDWLRNAGVLRAAPGAAADTLAGLLGLELDEAHPEAVVGLAVDFSMWNDMLPLPMLREMAATSGVPQALAAPLLACCGHARRVRADGLAGLAIRPEGGLAPRYLAATHSLALVAMCCGEAGTKPQDSVDDSVAICRGPRRLAAREQAWRATVAIACF